MHTSSSWNRMPLWAQIALGLGGLTLVAVFLGLLVFQLLAGLVLAIGAIFTARTVQVTQERNRIEHENQITDRFTRAIEQLGSGTLDVRLGDPTDADLGGTDLSAASLAGATLTNARCDARTRWPTGFDPGAAGAIVQVEPRRRA